MANLMNIIIVFYAIAVIKLYFQFLDYNRIIFYNKMAEEIFFDLAITSIIQ